MLYQAEHPRLVDTKVMQDSVVVKEYFDSWEVWCTSPGFKTPQRMPTTFSQEFTKAEVKNSRDVEEWLVRLTKYRKYIIWGL